jgi:hypothetical protein
MRASSSPTRWILVPSLLTLLLVPAASASTLADFQARFAQTVWSIQQSEAILRTLPQSSASVSVPDGLASYAYLVSENVAALASAATARDLSDADRKAMADGLNAVAVLLRDQAALAGNRGLAAGVGFASAEQACRSAVSQLSAAPNRAR